MYNVYGQSFSVCIVAYTNPLEMNVYNIMHT